MYTNMEVKSNTATGKTLIDACSSRGNGQGYCGVVHDSSSKTRTCLSVTEIGIKVQSYVTKTDVMSLQHVLTA